MIKAFDGFYNTEIKIICPQNDGTYSGSEEFLEKCTVLADVQPYTGMMREKEYGFSDSIKKKIYYKDEEIKTGDYAMIGDIKYRVIYTENRILGSMAILEEINA